MTTSVSLAVEVAGHALLLCPERAALDPRRHALFVADAHLGKDASFRARGVPVPTGSMLQNLARLDAMLARHRVDHLVFLGDLFHTRESHTPETLVPLAQWRTRHAALRLTLVVGNHDRHAGPAPTALGIDEVEEPYALGPWALCHHPGAVPGAYALAGHEHPVHTLRTRADALRLPCFRFGARNAVLPAFGAFTGGLERREPGSRVFVVAEDRVIAVP